MSAIAVIPARFASTRFRGKPLARDTGKYLIQHVVERASSARSVGRVIVATDDDRIASVVSDFGGECVLTRSDHPSGTDRVAEVAQNLDCDTVVNVQGDEPEIEPESIDLVVRTLEDSDDRMATLACPFSRLGECGINADVADPNNVKVVVSGRRALYFSRCPIPFQRSGTVEPLLHLGLYAYERSFLLKLATLPPMPLERAEGLEQLRVLEHGYSIVVGMVDRAAVGIDTPADYAAFVERYRISLSSATG